MPAELKQLVFGPVVIEWDARYKFPIAVNLDRVGYFTTVCKITYRYGDGDYPLVVDEDFTFDGASIPWLIRIVPGFAALDWHLLAALPHDYAIERPRKLPRSVADGIFVSVLLALAEYRTDGAKELTPFRKWLIKSQSFWMFMAVWSWTILTRIRHPPNNNSSKPPTIEVAPIQEVAPVTTQAEAVVVAKEMTKEETATPPPAPAIEVK